MMDGPYVMPINNFGLLGDWGPSAEDEAFFNSLPDEKQKEISQNCVSSEDFHNKVRIARLCQ